MLYEVITAPHDDDALAVHALEGLDGGGAADRFRLAQLREQVVARNGRLAPGGGVGVGRYGGRSRITSYNVCYTKLLRAFMILAGLAAAWTIRTMASAGSRFRHGVGTPEV